MIWLAIINNMGAIIGAIGGAALGCVNAYIVYQNWQAAKKHRETAKMLGAVAAVVGATPPAPEA